MDYRIRVLGTGVGLFAGPLRQWLASADVDARGGRGTAQLTLVAGEAKRFTSQGEACEFWRRQSTVRPLRPDGEPNRPLTAYTVEIEPAD